MPDEAPAADQLAQPGGDAVPAATAHSATDPLIGRTINGRFSISGEIASGGMGKVYRAVQAPLGRACAIKVLNPNYQLEQDPEFHKRFFLEASISAQLTHANTVTIFDYGQTDDGMYFMAMELLEGRTLLRAIREEGPFSEERATHIARQICRSLREAHGLGVIHRDLKPANIYLVEHGDEKDVVKVLDFGLVKHVAENDGLTQAGKFMGSPKYMAPEQIRGQHVDARTDIYALGIVLYEMLTKRVPFDDPNTVNILMAHVNERVPPLRDVNPTIQCSETLEAAIYKCVEKNPENRFASMDELLAVLKQVNVNLMTNSIQGHSLSSPDLGYGSGSGPQLSTGAGVVPTVLTAQPPAAPPTRQVMLPAIALAIAVAAVATFLMMRNPGDPAAGAAAIPSAAPAAAPSSSSPIAQAPAATATAAPTASTPAVAPTVAPANSAAAPIAKSAATSIKPARKPDPQVAKPASGPAPEAKSAAPPSAAPTPAPTPKKWYSDSTQPPPE